jgi:hypothetical protein
MDLTIKDLTILEGEKQPRIQDVRLGERLGFGRARRIRELVERNKDVLSQRDKVCRVERQTSSRGGRPSSGGLWILDSKDKKLGRIVHGQPQTTNLAFGGPDWKTLYFTNWNFLGSVNLRIAGMPVPAVKKA